MRMVAESVPLKYPASAAEINQTPRPAVKIATPMAKGVPIMIKAGENTKRTGMTYANHPKRIAAQPVAIEGALAIEAAAKAASAMGGVIIDIIPK